MNKYILHTGLHKTATKFFQHRVFNKIKNENIIYNPLYLTQYIADLLKAEDLDLPHVLEKFKKEKNKYSDKTIIISREIMSGNLFNFYKDYEFTYKRLALAFEGDNVQIICCLRYQVDWIVSAYRESIHEHHYQEFGQFIGFKKGESEFAKASIFDLKYYEIIKCIDDIFGENNVHYYFFENFKENKEEIVTDIHKLVGIPQKIKIYDGKSIPNRGYSALAIFISCIRYKIFKLLRIKNLLIHRPIYFFGCRSIPAGFEEISVLPKNKYWSEYFHRDNEEVRSKNYPNNLGILEKIKLFLCWRRIIKNVLDKIIYCDWNLIKNYELYLNNYFKEENKKLLKKFSSIEIPKKYLK